MVSHNYFSNSNIKKREFRKILIVCEGERTEPLYFDKFPINKEIIALEVIGEGKNTVSLVNEAIKKKKLAQVNGSPYIQVWVVFDKDSFKPKDFNAAISLCDANEIKYAITNEAFELWYLLHFNYYDSAMSRTQYESKLSKLFGRKYEKNQEDIYELLKDRQKQAIRAAIKLKKYHYDLNGKHDFCNSNPVTTVHELVEVLIDYIE